MVTATGTPMSGGDAHLLEGPDDGVGHADLVQDVGIGRAVKWLWSWVKRVEPQVRDTLPQHPERR